MNTPLCILLIESSEFLLTIIAHTSLTWDQAQFSFCLVNNIPAGKAKWKPSLAVALRDNVWEPLKLGLISADLSCTVETIWHHLLTIHWLPEVVLVDIIILLMMLRSGPRKAKCDSCLPKGQTVIPEFFSPGPVFWRSISINPRLNFNLDFHFLCSKAFFWTIFSILFRSSNRQILDKKNETEFVF